MRAPAFLLAIVLAAGAGAGCRSVEDAREHERAGAAHLQAGRIEEAVAELEAALGEDPGAIQAAASLAAIYERAGDAGRAIGVLNRLLEARPGAQLARMNLGRLHAGLGDFDRALEHYAVAGAGGVPHAPAYVAMAGIHELRSDPASAERALRRAIEIDPASPEPRYRLARLYDAVGQAEARAAWERFLGAAAGLPDERPRIEEAEGRLRLLAAELTPDERRASLAALRRRLETRPLPVHRGPLEAGQAQPVAGDPGPRELQRFFAGRVFATLYTADAAPVRGSGEGATLYEALAAAADELVGSRVYDLYYAASLEAARLEIHLEVGSAEPFAGDGPLGPDDALEARAGARTVVLLPSDRAARSLRTRAAAVAALLADAGLADTEARSASLGRFRTRGFVEAADGGGEAVELEGGLPVPPPVTRKSARDAVRGAADWIAASIGPDGAIPSAYDPATERTVTGTARTQAYAIVALAEAAQALGDERYRTAARLAYGWLQRVSPDRGFLAPAARAARRAGDPAGADAHLAALAALQRPDGGLDGAHASEEAALAFAESKAHRERATRALEAALRATHPVKAPLGSAGYLAAWALRADAKRLSPREGDGAGAIQANIGLGLLRGATPEGRRLVEESVGAALRLAVTEAGLYLYPDAVRARGGFRDDRFDRRISLEETARIAAALAIAAPHLPEAAPRGARR